jgi:hypothetical protein
VLEDDENDDHDDLELLTFQKQRTMPMVQLSEVNVDDEHH